MTVRLEAGSPIRVQPRPTGRGREIISVDPGQAAGEQAKTEAIIGRRGQQPDVEQRRTANHAG